MKDFNLTQETSRFAEITSARFGMRIEFYWSADDRVWNVEYIHDEVVVDSSVFETTSHTSGRRIKGAHPYMPALKHAVTAVLGIQNPAS